MHMADALISPQVGGAMWVASVGVSYYSVKKIQSNFSENIELSEKKIPLMGVMGAFIFAAQMINFSIPLTGSSGHLGGGMILAAILGPYAGFLTLLSILSIQALFFADGGLLALGSNIFNMGFYTCFIAYPFIFKKIVACKMSKKKILIASMLSAVAALQLGSFSVVLQTLLSGKTELPFETFLIFMQPIHLAIGIIEGFITSAVLSFVYSARPELLNLLEEKENSKKDNKKLILSVLCLAIAIGGFTSMFASSNPDGLEWSIEKTIVSDKAKSESYIHEALSNIQEKIAFLPDYGFKNTTEENEASDKAITSVSGIVGSLITLILAMLIGAVTSIFKKKRQIMHDINIKGNTTINDKYNKFNL